MITGQQTKAQEKAWYDRVARFAEEHGCYPHSNHTAYQMHHVHGRNHNPTWEAYIWERNVKHRIGYYRDFFEACCARKSKENRLKYHKNHGQVRPLYEFCDDVMQAIWSL